MDAGSRFPAAEGKRRPAKTTKGSAKRNIDRQGQNHTTTSTHPSRVPRTTGGCRRRFDDGAGKPPDARFTPPTGVPTVPEGAVGASAVTCSESDFATAVSVVCLSSASLAVASYSTVVWATIASMARSACARHA